MSTLLLYGTFHANPPHDRPGFEEGPDNPPPDCPALCKGLGKHGPSPSVDSDLGTINYGT